MTALPPIQHATTQRGADASPPVHRLEADRNTRRLIQHLARRLVWQAGLNPADRQDVEQDLWVDLVARWHRFDATRAGYRTFAARVVEHQVTKLYRKRQADSQDAERAVRSLEDSVADGEGQTIRLSGTLHDGIQRFRVSDCRSTPQLQFDIAADVATVVARLPVRLRDLCERLKESSIADVARDLGVTRAWIYRQVQKVRLHFVDAGLQEYFEIPAGASPLA